LVGDFIDLISRNQTRIRFALIRQSGLYEPRNHCREACLVFTANSLELQTHSASSRYVPDCGTGFDFSVLDKKMQFNR